MHGSTRATARIGDVQGSGTTQRSRGWFVTLDGPEGGGKTTHAARLAEHLRASGHVVRETREPGGTWLGERVREILLARTGSTTPTDPLSDGLLFNAARRQLIREVIAPALDAGETVVCARFADSTLAYQGYAAGVPLDVIRALAEAATDGLVPDLTFILDVPAEVGLGRKSSADVTRFEAEFDLDFHRRVRDGFLEIARAEPARVVVIDATRDVEAVAAEVAATVDRRVRESEPRAALVRTPS